MKKLLLLALITSSLTSMAQGVNREKNEAYKAYFDSLQTMDYDYYLPIYGKGAYRRGFDLQLAAGISPVYFTQTQEITIQSTSIGFNGGQKVDMSSFIEFGPTIATTHAYTVRPDIWLFPFLNLYGILGGGTTTTEVTLLKPIGFQTSQHFTAQSYGIGATLTGAVGPVWIAWDNNYNFVDVEALVEPVPAFNSSLRVGHNFLNPTRPDRSMAIWVGAFYQKLQNDTRGNLPISDIFPSVGTGQNIETMRDWASGLPPAQRLVANQIIDKIEEFGQGNDVGNATIDYELQKKVTAPFNLILGAQYQFNKNWIARTELGVFGKRSQFLLSLNYRFNLI
ncbi:hypothetical protein [Phaeocystidibacter marisrubri]|nr:hypothetical protein [Phaeocystidibacter marisrubri]GGH71458.1 hypothetical protein GCM10011318_14430 [Phaeocystidibacter marisrubri]